MNYPFAIAGVLTLMAFFAHALVGTKETLAIAPSRLKDKGGISKIESIERNWIQASCVFQMVSVDLLVLSGLLFFMAFTDILGSEKIIGFALGTFYLTWGSAWLLQLMFLKRGAKDFLLLGQWIFMFVCAGLIYWGAQAY